MTTNVEEIVRKAYHYAEGDVLDVKAFVDLFTEDGVFRDKVNGQEYRGEKLGDVVLWMSSFAPDVHRELHRFTVLGDVVAVELSIQGTFTKPFQSPAGLVQPTGGKLDIPTGDFWYLRDGKVSEFDCYVGVSVMLAQLGVNPDFASAVAATPTAA